MKLLEDTIEDYDSLIIDKIVISETNDELYKILDNELSEIEQKIIRMSYGIGCNEYKQKEISKILNIPQYKISRIKSRALSKLKKCINKNNAVYEKMY